MYARRPSPSGLDLDRLLVDLLIHTKDPQGGPPIKRAPALRRHTFRRMYRKPNLSMAGQLTMFKTTSHAASTSKDDWYTDPNYSIDHLLLPRDLPGLKSYKDQCHIMWLSFVLKNNICEILSSTIIQQSYFPRCVWIYTWANTWALGGSRMSPFAPSWTSKLSLSHCVAGSKLCFDRLVVRRGEHDRAPHMHARTTPLFFIDEDFLGFT